jgi:periplasmic protein TonB
MPVTSPIKSYRKTSFANIFLAVISAHLLVLNLMGGQKLKDPSPRENISYLETYSLQKAHSPTKDSGDQQQLNQESELKSVSESVINTHAKTVLDSDARHTAVTPSREKHTPQTKQSLKNNKKQSLDGNNSKSNNEDSSTATTASNTPPNIHATYLNNPAPTYPRTSRRLEEQGTVLLDVEIDIDGSASKVRVRKSSGYPRLDKSALETVIKWRFIPKKTAGMPQKMWVSIPINFVLE